MATPQQIAQALTNVSREQPVRPLTQIAVALGPNGQVKVVGQQAVSEEAHYTRAQASRIRSTKLN